MQNNYLCQTTVVRSPANLQLVHCVCVLECKFAHITSATSALDRKLRELNASQCKETTAKTTTMTMNTTFKCIARTLASCSVAARKANTVTAARREAPFTLSQ